jgi:hypothetical protein
MTYKVWYLTTGISKNIPCQLYMNLLFPLKIYQNSDWPFAQNKKNIYKCSNNIIIEIWMSNFFIHIQRWKHVLCGASIDMEELRTEVGRFLMALLVEPFLHQHQVVMLSSVCTWEVPLLQGIATSAYQVAVRAFLC